MPIYAKKRKGSVLFAFFMDEKVDVAVKEDSNTYFLPIVLLEKLVGRVERRAKKTDNGLPHKNTRMFCRSA
ncbi:hypothetical protein AM501_19460 [Aneurinibacillus migulanus]|uniref:Uncharacterized protein n=1 Tax=Aneurinibacillus migulanus TaxID=47500 RepID=A0A0D1W087_ANEMI|nr:hypothetical protein TS65_25400 [Aneurinibacillus migulanus]KIV54403.1 hypothetical protein TS64_15220 [Aneurinibacillus migulanus]KON98022.1 hypothetical protein AF333_23880 [Aneurinibacillus migulanus]KPD06798.1 hypothetical protein AM501_19460 [Aneurinibacillus migulanus]